jgi:hypothetical protein
MVGHEMPILDPALLLFRQLAEDIAQILSQLQHGAPLAAFVAQPRPQRRRFCVNASSTLDDVGDVSALPDLLDLRDQIEDPVRAVTADGAYDGEPI